MSVRCSSNAYLISWIFASCLFCYVRIYRVLTTDKHPGYKTLVVITNRRLIRPPTDWSDLPPTDQTSHRLLCDLTCDSSWVMLALSLQGNMYIFDRGRGYERDGLPLPKYQIQYPQAEPWRIIPLRPRAACFGLYSFGYHWLKRK